MEPVDVRRGEYQSVFDSEGLLLTPEVELEGRRERTVLKSGEATPSHATELRNTLLEFLARTKFATPGMDQLELPQLIALMPRTGRPPGPRNKPNAGFLESLFRELVSIKKRGFGS